MMRAVKIEGGEGLWALGMDAIDGFIEMRRVVIASSITDPAIALATALAIEGRRAAYQAEADPMFFEWQRGEKSGSDYFAKVNEIKARFPMPS